MFFLKSPVLSCFSTGRSTALVVDSGDNFTRTVAVHEGFCLLKSVRVAPYGGSQLGKQIEKVLSAKIGKPLLNKYAFSGKPFT